MQRFWRPRKEMTACHWWGKWCCSSQRECPQPLIALSATAHKYMYHTMYKHVLLYNTSIYTWIVGGTDERKHIFLGTLSLGQAAAVSTRKWCKKETNGKMLRVLKNSEKLNFLAHHLQKALTNVDFA